MLSLQMPTQWLTWTINGKVVKVLKLFLQKWRSLIFSEWSLKTKRRLTVKVGIITMFMSWCRLSFPGNFIMIFKFISFVALEKNGCAAKRYKSTKVDERFKCYVNFFCWAPKIMLKQLNCSLSASITFGNSLEAWPPVNHQLPDRKFLLAA